MATITALTQDFDGTDGAAITSAATIGAAALTGVGVPTFSGADPVQGPTCFRCAVTGTDMINARYDFTAVATAWFGFYFKTPSAAPAASQTIANWFGAANVTNVGTMRLNADMTITLRDVNQPVWTSAALPPSTWCRVAIKASPNPTGGTQQMRLYVGADRHNAVGSPTYDSGTVTGINSTMTTVDTLHVGMITGGAIQVDFDRLRGDNASEVPGVSVSGPPTVNAGPDLSKQVGTASFGITATATPAAGDTITSRLWTQTGVLVTLAGTGTDTVTVTPPTSTTGTTTLTFAATASGGTSSDSVIITWNATGQTIRPASDVSNNGWTVVPSGSLFAAIRDASGLDAATYILCPAGATGQVYRTRLDAIPVPSVTSGWYLDVFGFDLPDVATSSVVFKLYEADGTTLRKTWSAITDLATTMTNRQLTLTGGEVAAITSWLSGLILEMAATVT